MTGMPQPPKFVLAVDEGTTSARAAIYNQHGERAALEAIPFEARYPNPGWVEQDAGDIWQAQLTAIRAAIRHSGVGVHSIAACGITHQRETTLLWDPRPGQPTPPAIVGQCRRTADFCSELARSSAGPAIELRTG